MSDIKILHNPRCGTSRKAIAILDDMKVDYQVVLYLDKKWKQKEIKEILKMLGMKGEEIVRKREAIYKENYAGKSMTAAQWIKALSEYPKLIERPIVIKGESAIVARPVDKISSFLKG